MVIEKVEVEVEYKATRKKKVYVCDTVHHVSLGG